MLPEPPLTDQAEPKRIADLRNPYGAGVLLGRSNVLFQLRHGYLRLHSWTMDIYGLSHCEYMYLHENIEMLFDEIAVEAVEP